MTMLRTLSAIGTIYVLFCLGLAGRELPAALRPSTGPASSSALSHGLRRSLLPPTAGAEWFARNRPSCNALEAESLVASDPPPSTEDGASYEAACLAIAGRIDRARAVLEGLPADGRTRAASVVFDIGHSVADGGDERSAEPILSLVLQYQPENPMALYHVGMSEFGRYDRKKARVHLEKFLEVYTIDDITRQAAERALPYTDAR